MKSLFITVLNMSITASYVALIVIFARLLLKKAPKIFSYSLWIAVFFRLLCPFSFKSAFSLVPSNNDSIPHNIVSTQNPAIQTGINIVDNVVNQTIQSTLPPAHPEASLNPMGLIVEILAVIWLLGIAVLLCYGAISYFRLKHQLSTATLVEDNIFESDRIKTPFVLGFINPKIYIPTGLLEKELDYILKHEMTHIKHKDYLIKPVAFLALTIHWFNPLMWISYFLMANDMEMSCDESVMKHSSDDIRKSYSTSLLSLSAKQSGLLIPLAFGESNVKSRIKNVLNYKKPAFWIIIVSIAAIAAVAIGLMTNPKEKDATGSVFVFPESWNGKYVTTPVEALDKKTVIEVFHKANNEKFKNQNPKFGWLFSIMKLEKSEIGNEQWQKRIEAGEAIPFGMKSEHKGDMVYVALLPMDMQFDSTVNDLRIEYESMERDIWDIIKGFMGKNKIKAYDMPVLTNQIALVKYRKGEIINTVVFPRENREGFEQISSIVLGGKLTKIMSVNDVPSVKKYVKVLLSPMDIYYIYEKDEKYYIEKPYQYINEIPYKDYEEILLVFGSILPDPDDLDKALFLIPIQDIIEQYKSGNPPENPMEFMFDDFPKGVPYPIVNSVDDFVLTEGSQVECQYIAIVTFGSHNEHKMYLGLNQFDGVNESDPKYHVTSVFFD